MMLVPRPDGHAHHAPVAEDVLVGIEVSDTSLRTDLRIKVPLCARTGQTLRVCPRGLQRVSPPNVTSYPRA